uniref:Uncharacterized protein n=1 Tax=Strigamia maritima TaxID=126957 RepID=T1JJ99_STRMM
MDPFGSVYCPRDTGSSGRGHHKSFFSFILPNKMIKFFIINREHSLLDIKAVLSSLILGNSRKPDFGVSGSLGFKLFPVLTDFHTRKC